MVGVSMGGCARYNKRASLSSQIKVEILNLTYQDTEPVKDVTQQNWPYFQVSHHWDNGSISHVFEYCQVISNYTASPT